VEPTVEPTEGTDAPTEGTEPQPTDPVSTPDNQEKADNDQVWIYVAIVLGVLIVGTVVAIVVILLKKKTR
jgi:hypothetical protein